MENFFVAKTERSPEVNFDFSAGILALRGESYPEDASLVFGPIFAALETFFAETRDGNVRLDVELIYFNSSSAKALMNMFLLLDKAAANGVSLVVNWRYAAEDDTMKEFGEDFSEDLEHVAFHLVVVDPVG